MRGKKRDGGDAEEELVTPPPLEVTLKKKGFGFEGGGAAVVGERVKESS